MALGFLKLQALDKMIGLLRSLHCGFNNDNSFSLNYLRSNGIARDANDYTPTGVHPNTEGCVLHPTAHLKGFERQSILETSKKLLPTTSGSYSPFQRLGSPRKMLYSPESP